MAKNQRSIDNAFLNSGNDAQAIEYNPASGGQKSLIVGPRLIPIRIVAAGVASWTTNVSGTAVGLPSLGATLAIYNNSGTAASVTTGDVGVTSQAIGAVDANGNVGVALPPNAWTYLSMGNRRFIISSASTVIVYIIEDPTFFTQESTNYMQQNSNGALPST